MTTEWRETTPCPNCGVPVSTEQPVKAWIRTNPELDSIRQCLCIGDSDLWVQRYGVRRNPRTRTDRSVMYLMLVEVKAHGRDLDDSQRDLLSIVNQLLRTLPWKEQRDGGRFLPGHSQNARIVYGYIAGQRVQVQCYGVHKLRMSGATPSDSARITWDNKPISREKLVDVLRYDLNPDNLRRLEHRSHKLGGPDHPQLTGLAELFGGPA